MGREIRIPKRPVKEAVEGVTYRIVVGEKGNERGHIEYLDDGTTESQAKQALRKALRAYAGDGWGRVEYDVEGTGWRKLGESKRRVVESGAADLIGSGTLPNKYYVSHHGDFQVLRNGNELDWASEDEDLSSRVTFGNGGEDGVFDTFDAALEEAESVAEGISEDADDLRSVIIEDHISGVIYEIILVAYPTKFGYKFEVETRDNTRFTREKLGSKFESKRRVVEEVSASQIPVDEVVAELKDIRDDMAVTPSEDGIESEDDFMDVRLQVLDDGSWVLHTGDASYDTDHHGSWGASEIVPTMTDEELREMAEDLINQAEDMRAQVESRPRAGKKGLQERYKEQNPPKNWTPATVIGKLQRLQKQHPAEYDRLTDAWRDHLPHTGEQDVLLGSPKFKQWLESEYQEWVEYPKEWQNWATFCTDIQGLLTSEGREAQVESRLRKGRQGLQEGRKENNPPKSWTPATVLKKLQVLQKRDPGSYAKLVEAWRDTVPHTGEQDILLGSPKFEVWLKTEYQEWLEYPEEWQNWATFCTDIQGLLTSEGREAQGSRKGLLEAEHNVDWGSLDEFTQGYIEALMWVAQDEEGYAYDNLTFDALEPETVQKMVADCESFQSQNAELLAQAYKTLPSVGHAGHDFALTRNGHGAGFWGRGLGKVGDKLTDAAHAFGEYDLRTDDPEDGPWYGESKTRKSSQSALKESDSSEAGWVGFFVKGMPHYAYRMDGTHLKLGFSAGDPRAVVYHVDQLRDRHPALHTALTAWLNGRGELEGMRFEESRKVEGKPSLTEGYTPGPWVVSQRYTGNEGGHPVGAYRIAQVHGGTAVAQEVYKEDNARLIAAAPEMYELLQSAISLWGFMKSDPSLSQDEREAAQRSYDKAKGVMQKAVIESRKVSRQRVVEEVEDQGTYIIYTSHLSNDPNDDVDAAAERLADHLRQKFPGLEVQIQSGVEGVGSGYQRPDKDLDAENKIESDIEYEVEHFDIWKESRTVHPRRRVVRESTPRSYSATQPQSSVSESTQESSFLYVYDGTGGPVTAVLKAGDMEEAAQIAKAVAGEWYDEQENAMNLEVGATVAAGEIESFGYDSDLGFTLSPNERLYPKAVATEDRGSTQRPLIERKRKVDITGLQKRGKPVQTFQFKSFTVDKAKAEKEGQ